MVLAAGTRFDHYEILAPLGAGGMGEVYRARDTRLDREVAIKVLPADFTSDADRLKRFEQEARATSALNHPNILTVYDVGAHEGAPYIVAELLDGEDLRAQLQGGALPVPKAIEYAQQIAAGLTAAHERGIIHRDLKPENLFVTKDGRVKILDFGLAKLKPQRLAGDVDSKAPTLRPLTGPETVLGTPSYMSPEQARGQELDARTDLFSLGVVCYEMIAGRSPFGGVNALEVISEILKSEPRPLSSHGAEIPSELQRIVGKALHKNPDERYQTARDLLNDLKDLKEELSFAARRARSDLTEGNEAAPTAGGVAATASSAKIILSEIRRHKLGVGMAIGLLLLTAAAGGYFLSSSGSSTGAINSIAVLPFVNASDNSDVEYLSDGMTESLINSLSQLPNLSVKARSIVFRYKSKEVEPQQVGSELNVQAVLNGRVVQRGDQLMLGLELVDTRTGNQIWGEQYTRQMSDLLPLQAEIARNVSNKLRVKLSGADAQRLTKNYTENADAYQLYLKGRFYWNKRTTEGFQKSIEYFNQAVAIDRDYTLAYTGLADAYTLLSIFDAIPPREGMTKARDYALRSISLDSNLADPHAALGLILTQYDYDFAEAEREYKRAIELNPNYPQAHQWYGQMLGYSGRFEEGIAETRRALEFDLLSLPINWNYGLSFYYARKYDHSIEQLKKTLELDPNFRVARISLAQVYQAKGSYAESVEEYAKSEELFGADQNARVMRKSFARGGWQEFLRVATSEPHPFNLWPVTFTALHAELGQKDKALAELNSLFEARTSDIRLLRIDPLFDPLRSDTRFQQLLKKVGFPR
jgi:serine/threonine protein kinase